MLRAIGESKDVRASLACNGDQSSVCRDSPEGVTGCQVTDTGLRHALFLTRAHTRLLRTGLAEIHGPPVPTKLRAATHAYETAITELTRAAGLAA
jgi:hypothetical protein